MSFTLGLVLMLVGLLTLWLYWRMPSRQNFPGGAFRYSIACALDFVFSFGPIFLVLLVLDEYLDDDLGLTILSVVVATTFSIVVPTMVPWYKRLRDDFNRRSLTTPITPNKET